MVKRGLEGGGSEEVFPTAICDLKYGRIFMSTNNKKWDKRSDYDFRRVT